MDHTEKVLLLNLVNEACSLQVRLFDTMTKIEALTDKTYTNLADVVSQYAVDYEGLSLNELDQFLEELEAESDEI